MLVLSRKLNQSIMIGEDVEVVVLEIKGDAVKIGINAPRTVPVFRQEVYQEIKAENVRAAASRAASDASQLLKQAIQAPVEPPDDK